MKLTYLDKFADWLLNTPLLELAQERDRKIDKIENLSNPLNEHLFKLYVMQKSSHREHWTDEINNFLFTINNTGWGKKKHKFESSDYKEWLYSEYFYNLKGDLNKNLNKILSNMLKKYESEEKIKWSLKEFMNMCESFYDYFCPKLEATEYEYEDLEKYIEERFTFE
jgi:hypothetical protein